MSHLQRAIDRAGSQKALAEAMTKFMGREISQQLISYWLNERDGVVPADYCRAIESATDGDVTRYQLQPDIFGPPPPAAAMSEGRA